MRIGSVTMGFPFLGDCGPLGANETCPDEPITFAGMMGDV